jgi:hypothetical protein
VYDDDDGKGRRFVMTFNTTTDATKEVNISDLSQYVDEFGYRVSDSTNRAISEPLIVVDTTIFMFVAHVKSMR